MYRSPGRLPCLNLFLAMKNQNVRCYSPCAQIGFFMSLELYSFHVSPSFFVRQLHFFANYVALASASFYHGPKPLNPSREPSVSFNVNLFFALFIFLFALYYRKSYPLLQHQPPQYENLTNCNPRPHALNFW